MQRDELVELAKQYGLDASQVPAELTDAHLEAVVGGMSPGESKIRFNNTGNQANNNTKSGSSGGGGLFGGIKKTLGL